MMKLYKWMMPIAKLMGMASPEKMTEQMDDMIGCYKTKNLAMFEPTYAWYNRETICTDIPHPTGSIDAPDSQITPFNVIEISLYDDGSTPEVVENPNGHALGFPVPRTFVARAGGKGKRARPSRRCVHMTTVAIKMPSCAIPRSTSICITALHRRRRP